MPLIIAGPGIPAGESDALVMLFDLFPTIADLTRTSLPDGVEGHDLAEIWRGSSTETRDVLYTVYEDLQRSVRDERWKLIRYPKIDRMQLFDLQCIFRSKLDSESGGKWTANPIETGQ